MDNMSSIKYFFIIILTLLFIPTFLEYFFTIMNQWIIFFLSNFEQAYMAYGNLTQPKLIEDNIFSYLLEVPFSIIFYITIIALFVLVIKIVGDIFS